MSVTGKILDDLLNDLARSFGNQGYKPPELIVSTDIYHKLVAGLLLNPLTKEAADMEDYRGQFTFHTVSGSIIVRDGGKDK